MRRRVERTIFHDVGTALTGALVTVVLAILLNNVLEDWVNYPILSHPELGSTKLTFVVLVTGCIALLIGLLFGPSQLFTAVVGSLAAVYLALWIATFSGLPHHVHIHMIRFSLVFVLPFGIAVVILKDIEDRRIATSGPRRRA